MEHIKQNEELYRAWIGQKNQDKYYERMKSGGFNVIAYLLPDILFITRKMYLEFVLYLITILIMSFILTFMGVSETASKVVIIAIRIAVGFFYYPLYKWSIKRKIEKYRNKGISDEEQLEIAQKYGGDKITPAVIAIIVIYIIAIMALQLFLGLIVVYKDVTNSSNITSGINDNTRLYEAKGNNSNGIWKLEDFNLKYDTDIWKETTLKSRPALTDKYNDNYFCEVMVTNTSTEIAEMLGDESTREEMIQSLKRGIESDQANEVVDYKWTKINDNMYRCCISTVIYNGKGYANYYYYLGTHKTYLFTASSIKKSNEFIEEVEEILDTMPNNI